MGTEFCAGLANSLGGSLGQNQANTLQQAQQQAFSQQYMQGVIGYGTTAETGYYATNATITISPTYGITKKHPSKSRAETALEWLDRRVEEMRVAL